VLQRQVGAFYYNLHRELRGKRMYKKLNSNLDSLLLGHLLSLPTLMKVPVFISIAILLLVSHAVAEDSTATDFTAMVDPFIGTGSGGYAFLI
jgi:hypothetical protein